MDSIYIILYLIVFIAVIIFLDLRYLRYDFWKRLIINIIVALVFAAFYLLFLNNP